MSAIGRVAVVVAASLVVGFGGGYGLSQLGGDDDSPSPSAATGPGGTAGTAGTAAAPPAAPEPAPTTATSATPAPTTATTAPTAPSTSDADAPVAAANTLNVSVVSATYVAATTDSGRRRKRARLAVQLKVRNRSAAAADLGPATITFGQDSVRRDSAAREAAAGLAKPLPPEQEVTGELRFETAGAVTTRLAQQSSVTLKINGQTVQVPVKK